MHLLCCHSHLFKIGFKAFLNITPTITHGPPPPAPSGNVRNSATSQPSAGSTFTLTLEENPLAEFVELPDEVIEGELWFSNVLCGVIRGALEMVQMQVSVEFVSDVLRGDETTEMQVKLLKYLEEEVPIADD